MSNTSSTVLLLQGNDGAIWMTLDTEFEDIEVHSASGAPVLSSRYEHAHQLKLEISSVSFDQVQRIRKALWPLVSDVMDDVNPTDLRVNNGLWSVTETGRWVSVSRMQPVLNRLNELALAARVLR